MEKRLVYADFAATAVPSERALNKAMPYLKENFGNASGMYALGMRSARAVLDARKSIAASLGAKPEEIFFTSGGTESDNWAVRAAAESGARKGKRHLISSAVEHHAVINTLKALETKGFTVTYLPVDKEGRLTAEQVREAITDDTALVSVMTANNETGTIYPVDEIAEICRSRGVLFHTDAVQAVGHIPMDLSKLGADMVSLSGHKFGAMKGIGALYVRKGADIGSFMTGGAQESGRRAGTENVAAIVSMAEALAESLENMDAVNARLTVMRDRLIDGLTASIPDCFLNGGRENRLAGNVNLSVKGVDGESMLLMLDMMGIMASSGSACAVAQKDPSHVLLALGVDRKLAHGSLRLSLGCTTTDEDVDYMLERIPEAVSKLRALR